jgi:hypothetical protein
VQDQAEAVFVYSAVLTVVDSQSAIADESVEGRLPHREIETVAAKKLPSEIATDAETAYIAEEL